MLQSIIVAVIAFSAGVTVASTYASYNMRRLRIRLESTQAAQVERISNRVLERLTAALGDDE